MSLISLALLLVMRRERLTWISSSLIRVWLAGEENKILPPVSLFSTLYTTPIDLIWLVSRKTHCQDHMLLALCKTHRFRAPGAQQELNRCPYLAALPPVPYSPNYMFCLTKIVLSAQSSFVSKSTKCSSAILLPSPIFSLSLSLFLSWVVHLLHWSKEFDLWHIIWIPKNSSIFFKRGRS